MAHEVGHFDTQSGGRPAQTWAAFLKELRARGGLTRELAERAASSVLCTLEQRLLAGEVEDLEEQLPRRLQELLNECPLRDPSQRGGRFTRAEFLQRIADDLGCEPDEAEHLARAVFDTVRDYLSEGEEDDVSAELPDDLQSLWAAPL